MKKQWLLLLAIAMLGSVGSTSVVAKNGASPKVEPMASKRKNNTEKMPGMVNNNWENQAERREQMMENRNAEHKKGDNQLPHEVGRMNQKQDEKCGNMRQQRA
ncbi:MAG: hypothetical protein ACRC6X_07890 [Culicoidibacterales bacterium]